MLDTVIKPARALAKMGLGGIGLPLASAAAGLGAGPGGPAVTDRHWHRMAQQTAAWGMILTNVASRSAFIGAREYAVMGGRGKQILWRPFQVGKTWYATVRLAGNPNQTTNPLVLYGYAPSGGGGGSNGPMTVGAVPGSAVNNALQPTLRLDEHGVVTTRSLFGIGAGSDSAAIIDQSLRRWGQLPVQPDAASPNWHPLSATDLTLLDKTAGWSQAVGHARAVGESMFRFRGSWFMFAGAGYKVLGGGSGSGGHRYMAGIGAGVGLYKSTFVPITQADIDATSTGIPLQQAAMALNQYIAANGVPSEHTDNAVVKAFQIAYNNDPVSDIHNDSSNNGKLDEDGGLGENTAGVYGVIMGIDPPTVNTTRPSTSTSTTTTTDTTVVTGGKSYTVPIVATLLVVAAGGVGYAAFHHKKKHRVQHRHPAHA